MQKKDKSTTKDCSLTEANLLGSYKVTSVKYKAPGSTSEVEFIDQFFDVCEKDDVTTFNADHTYAYTDAGTACALNGDGVGTWSLVGTTATVDGQSGTIENFSCSGFTAVGTDEIAPGDKVSLIYTRQ
ncbi:MAG: lipocalin family protein [Ginsengibacter sp.]